MMQKHRKGETSDKALLDIIKKHSGLSMYELGQRIGWKIGHIDGSVRRLLNSQKIIIITVDRNGRTVNLVYPRSKKHPAIVEVPKNLLKTGNPTWQKEAYVYALDSNTVGISGKRNKDWKSFACFGKRVDLTTKKNTLSLRLPQEFVDFYNLESRHVVKTINENNILLTVSGNIIDTKKYPS